MLPGRARSTGLGPLLGRAERPGRGKSRSPPATSRAVSPLAAWPAARHGADPRHQPHSRQRADASTSRLNRSPAPAADTPTGSRYAARTGSHRALDGQELSAGRVPASAPEQATTALPATTVHQKRPTDLTLSSPRTVQRASKPTVTSTEASVRTSLVTEAFQPLPAATPHSTRFGGEAIIILFRGRFSACSVWIFCGPPPWRAK